MNFRDIWKFPIKLDRYNVCAIDEDNKLVLIIDDNEYLIPTSTKRKLIVSINTGDVFRLHGINNAEYKNGDIFINDSKDPFIIIRGWGI